MADKKISALTAATTPLAGTEVLPIVQSGSTVKVANNDLRPKQIQSNATTGVLQVVGPAAAATRVMTVPDANFTAARTDAAQSFTGDQTLSTGNLIQGTAAKGVNFTANTPAAGMTSQLLNWYEEGTFTPTIVGTGSSGVGTYSSQVGRYTRIGRQVTVQIELAWSAHTGTGDMFVAGLPFACSTVRSSISAISYDMALAANCYLGGRVTASDTTIELLNLAVGGGAWSGVAMDTSVVALVVTATYTV